MVITMRIFETTDGYGVPYVSYEQCVTYK